MTVMGFARDGLCQEWVLSGMVYVWNGFCHPIIDLKEVLRCSTYLSDIVVTTLQMYRSRRSRPYSNFAALSHSFRENLSHCQTLKFCHTDILSHSLVRSTPFCVRM